MARVGLALLVSAALLSVPLAAAAQCASNASSCVACHETQGARPVLADHSAWHSEHGFGDLCAACHAGDPTAAERPAAHAGRREPLDDAAAACGSCHHEQASTYAERYRSRRAATKLHPPQGPAEAQSQRHAPPPAAFSAADAALAALALVLSVPLVVLGVRCGRDARARPPSAGPPRAVYVAGALLGVVVAISELALSRPIAVSGAFDRLGAYAGARLFPESQYYAHVMQPRITWQVWTVLGLLIGSASSALASRTLRWRWLPERQWQSRFGAGRARRLAIAFGGAVLVQIGAGIAGGCTSGLAISGGALLAPGAFLFMAGMFAGGIPTAWLIYRRSAADV